MEGTKFICVLILLKDFYKFASYVLKNEIGYYTKTYYYNGDLFFIHKYIDLDYDKKQICYDEKIPGTDINYKVFYFSKKEIKNFIQSNKYKYLKGCDKINELPEFFYEKPKSEKIINDIIKNKKYINEKTICKIILNVLSIKFIYDSKTCEWYYIDKNNRYIIESRENLYLIKLISSEIPKYFKKIINPKIDKLQDDLDSLYTKIKDSDNTEEVQYLKSQTSKLRKKIKNINKIKIQLINFCERITSINKSIEMLKTSMCDHLLSDKIDNVNDKLLGFNNGVYDFENGIFRKPRIDEYISKTTKYDYEEADQESKDYISKLIDSMFKNKEESKYVIGSIALCLACHVSDECFYIWIGGGRNGKGLLKELIIHTFGEYYSFMKSNYLTGRILSSHDEELYYKKGVRICILSEPIVNSKTGEVDADMSFLKQVAGLDEFRARTPYGVKSLEFKGKFKLIIQTNNYIKFPGTDTSIITKFSNIVFPYSFIKEEDRNKDDPMQKKCEEGLKELIKEKKYVLAFLSILIDEYKYLKNNGFKLKIPKDFTDTKMDYMAECDPIQDFIDKYLIKTETFGDCVSSSLLFQHFKIHMADKSNGISNMTFKDTMIRKKILWKKHAKARCFHYIKLKDIMDVEDVKLEDIQCEENKTKCV